MFLNLPFVILFLNHQIQQQHHPPSSKDNSSSYKGVQAPPGPAISPSLLGAVALSPPTPVVGQLTEMGFSMASIEGALAALGQDSNVEALVVWLLEHAPLQGMSIPLQGRMDEQPAQQEISAPPNPVFAVVSPQVASRRPTVHETPVSYTFLSYTYKSLIFK